MPWLDWISLFVRWFHVVAGVAWIGASFYFIWLDNNLRTPPKWKQDKEKSVLKYSIKRVGHETITAAKEGAIFKKMCTYQTQAHFL